MYKKLYDSINDFRCNLMDESAVDSSYYSFSSFGMRCKLILNEVIINNLEYLKIDIDVVNDYHIVNGLDFSNKLITVINLLLKNKNPVRFYIYSNDEYLTKILSPMFMIFSKSPECKNNMFKNYFYFAFYEQKNRHHYFSKFFNDLDVFMGDDNIFRSE